MNRRHWGSLVTRELAILSPLVLAACSPAAPEPVTPVVAPPPPIVSAPPVVAEPPPPPPIAPRLGEFVKVATSSAEPQPFPVRRLFARSSTFAIEVADLRREWGRPACPVTGPGCNLVAVAPYGSALSTKDRLGSATPAGIGAFSEPAPGAAGWTELSSGKDVVYGARRGPHLTIDRIDGKGVATPFAVDEHDARWSSAKVVELDAGPIVVGEVDGDDGVAVLSVARVEAKAGGAAISEPVALPYALVSPFRASAQGARQAEGNGGRAAVWGPWFATALPDASGKIGNAWAIALVQVNPPPFNWKAGRAYRKPEKKEDKRGAKHGCGGPGSRSLTDRSVEKVLRVLRFEGAKLVSDVVVDRPAGYDAHELPITVEPGAEGELVVDGIAWGADGKKHGGKAVHAKASAPPDVPGLTGFTFAEPPNFRHLEWDDASHEGMLSADGGREPFAQRFDAKGAPVGEVLRAKGVEDTPVRVGDVWVGWGWQSVIVLTGPATGKSVAWSHEDGGATAARAKGGALELFLRGRKGCQLMAVDIPSLDQKSSPPLGLCSDIAPPVASWQPVRRGDKDLFVVGRYDQVPSLSDADGNLTPIDTLPAGEGVAHTEVLQVFGDTVVVRKGKPGTTATWVALGKTEAFVEHETRGPAPSRKRRRFAPPDEPQQLYLPGAPIVGDGMLLPDQPGQPFDPVVLRDAATRGCLAYRATGPRTAVLACVEPTDAKKPGLSIGLRSFSY